MPNEFTEPTPQDGTTDSKQEEPQVSDPTLDNQTETTEPVDDKATEKREREEFYQTKYQKEKANNEAILKELQDKEAEWTRSQPTPNTPDTVEPSPPEEQHTATERQGYDLYDPEGQKAFEENLIKNVTAANKSTYQQIQAEEQRTATQRQAVTTLNRFVAENNIPQETVDRVVNDISRLMQNPYTQVNFIIERINALNSKSIKDDDIAHKAAEAARKAKELEKVPIVEGDSPSLTKNEKSMDEVVGDKFVKSGDRPADNLFK